MRNRFDQLGKQIGQQALKPCGTTVAHDEISPDAQHAGLRHEPVASHSAQRAQLGLLGRLTSVLCLLELYGHAPGEDEVLACLGKLIAFRHKRARSFRHKRGPQQNAVVKPFLWILSAGRPDAVLKGLGCVPAQGWPSGDKGLKQGQARGAAKSVLTVLRTRGIRVPKAARERILAQEEPELLNRWLKRALRATTAAEIFQEPN